MSMASHAVERESVAFTVLGVWWGYTSYVHMGPHAKTQNKGS